MEFYFELLRLFTMIEEKILGIYTNTKFMLTAKVNTLNFGLFIISFCFIISAIDLYTHSFQLSTYQILS